RSYDAEQVICQPKRDQPPLRTSMLEPDDSLYRVCAVDDTSVSVRSDDDVLAAYVCELLPSCPPDPFEYCWIDALIYFASLRSGHLTISISIGRPLRLSTYAQPNGNRRNSCTFKTSSS